MSKESVKAHRRVVYWRGTHQTKVFESDLRLPSPRERKNELKIALKLQKDIKKILTSSSTNAKVLQIVVLKSKQHHFLTTDLTGGFTHWRAVGSFEGKAGKFKDEKNVVLEIQFEDDRIGNRGRRLVKLLNDYNMALVGEQILYFKIYDVSTRMDFERNVIVSES